MILLHHFDESLVAMIIFFFFFFFLFFVFVFCEEQELLRLTCRASLKMFFYRSLFDILYDLVMLITFVLYIETGCIRKSKFWNS